MEMEDHQSHHHTQYGIDLRQFISGRPTHFSSPTAAAIPHPTPQAAAAELFSVGHTRNLQSPPQGHHHYDMMMLMPRATTGVGFHEFRSESCTAAGDACVGPAAPSAAAASGGVVVMSSSAAGAGASAAAAAPTPLGGLDAEGVAGSFRGDGGTGRWPRQETLTLLEIRSRLDSKFKEANQKGPLWDEVSRIMAEEHGYQRSGKKCREKFENLYKYYKKTKEGKAGRQDGKHYRFFRQLEALYGDTSNSNSVPEPHFVGTSLRFHNVAHISTQANQEAFPSHQKACDSLSLSNSLDFDTSSSEDNDPSTATLADNDSTEKRRKRRGGKGWKTKIKEFIDSQMRKLIDKQEAWLEKLTKTLEQKEQERLFREEEWRKQEAARIDREHKFWAKERAWIEARDSALMEALHKLTGREANASSPVELMGVHEIQNQSEIQNENGSETINNSVKSDHSWPESEITRLIQLRTSMDSRFQQSECREEILWEEIAAKMVYLGYERSASMCKDKWDSINHHLSRAKDCNKKRKENSRSGCYFPCNESVYTPGGPYSCELNDHHQQGAAETLRLQANDGSSPANSNAGNAVSDSCFRFLMTEGETLWENYGLKLSKGDHRSHN